MHFRLALITTAFFFVSGFRYSGESRFITANNSPVQLQRSTGPITADLARNKNYQNLLDQYPGSWQSVWDENTKTPLRLATPGIPVVNSSQVDVAIGFAQLFLDRHVSLFAPGASSNDFSFKQVKNTHGVVAVEFQQHLAGLRVEGSLVRFSFKHGKLALIGSTAIPVDTAVAPIKTVSAQRAKSWIDSAYKVQSSIEEVRQPLILPIRHKDGRITVHATTPVVVSYEGKHLPGKWAVYMDGTNPIARRQLLYFGTTDLHYNTPTRWPGGARQDYPAKGVQVSREDSAVTIAADPNGTLTWPEAGDLSVIPLYASPDVQVQDDSGSSPVPHNLLDGMTTVLQSADALIDGALTVLIHTGIVKDHIRQIDPGFDWLEESILAIANYDSECNAFFSGDSIVMFQGFTNCSATSRMPDVIYHEFGHYIHYVRYNGDMDPALSEGISDYLAATITDDPDMGIGFFKNTTPLRSISPDLRWPENIDNDSHVTGLIIAGALWDLRVSLVNTLGEEQGRAQADAIFYGIITHADDIPSSHMEALLVDDDDGDLSNGTPNQCQIDRAFAIHGLVAGETEGSFSHSRKGRTLIAPNQIISSAACGDISIQSISIDWVTSQQSGKTDMELVGDEFQATLPIDSEKWVTYRMTVIWSDSAKLIFPRNPADPFYRYFNGPLEEIVCFDLENNPAEDGWKISAGQWGQPSGENGPTQAYSGENILSTALDGSYPPNSTVTISTPSVKIGNYARVFLQYRRWLSVEDGLYDQASIFSNDQSLWTNQVDEGSTHHRDQEWREHQLEITENIQEGQVSLSFAVQSDGGFQLSGWNVDEVCFMGLGEAVCGDGLLQGAEQCDEGEENHDKNADACRSSCKIAFCGDGVVDSGEVCDPGAGNCNAECTAIEEKGCCNSSSPADALVPLFLGFSSGNSPNETGPILALLHAPDFHLLK